MGADKNSPVRTRPMSQNHLLGFHMNLPRSRRHSGPTDLRNKLGTTLQTNTVEINSNTDCKVEGGQTASHGRLDRLGQIDPVRPGSWGS